MWFSADTWTAIAPAFNATNSARQLSLAHASCNGNLVRRRKRRRISGHLVLPVIGPGMAAYMPSPQQSINIFSVTSRVGCVVFERYSFLPVQSSLPSVLLTVPVTVCRA